MAVFVRTVTFYYTGRVAAVTETELVLVSGKAGGVHLSHVEVLP